MSLIIKFKKGDEVRSFGTMKANEASLEKVKTAVAKCFKFKNVAAVEKFGLQYADEEGDMIRIAEDYDLQEAFALHTDLGHTELTIVLTNANAADFGFELIDDPDEEFGVGNRKPSAGKKPVVEEKKIEYVAPIPEPKVITRVEEVIKYIDHPLTEQLLAEFVEHISCSDRQVFPANSRIRKTWRMQNIGARDWPEGCILTWTSGDDSLKAREFITKVVRAGEMIDVTVDVTVPSRPGRYTAFYRLTEPSGKKFFGPHVWLDLVVNGPVEEKSVYVAPVEPVKPVVVTPAVEDECPQTFGKYNNGMLQLWKMGYKDTGRNLYLLDKYNGDVQSVVLFLIEHST